MSINNLRNIRREDNINYQNQNYNNNQGIL